MKVILFILPCHPCPPFAGQTRIAHGISKVLRRKGYSIDLISISTKKLTTIEAKQLSGIFDHNYHIRLSRFDLLLAALNAIHDRFLKGIPLSTFLFANPTIKSKLKRALKSYEPSSTMVHLLSIKSYLIWQELVDMDYFHLIDLVDSMKLNFSERARVSVNPFTKLFWIFEHLSVSKLEDSLQSHPKRIAYTVVSSVDASHLKSKIYNKNDATPIYSTSIGIDNFSSLSPSSTCCQDRYFLFFGSLHYEPNITALTWFMSDVFTLLDLDKLGLKFVVSGRNPSRNLRSILNRKYVELIENPLDMTPLIDQALFTIAPMQSGSGQQFKIVESLARGRAVVSTTKPVHALNLRAGQHLLACDTASEFAAGIIKLSQDPEYREHLALTGHYYVQNHYSWTKVAEKYEYIYNNHQ